MRVSLNSYPAYAKTHVVDFPKLNGGLNIRELNYRLDANQSPEMQNLWWQDGVLQCRDGQRYLSNATTLGTGWACTEESFWGHAFFHIGAGLYCAEIEGLWSNGEIDPDDFTLTAVLGNVPQNRGTFFRYDGCLFYKNRGGFYKISYQESTQSFTATDMSQPENTFTPTILINADPTTGSGASYQPENRLNPRKEVQYSAKAGIREYKLPVKDIDSVVQVTVGGAVKTVSADYVVDLTEGTVTFMEAPAVTDPPTNNSVVILYSKENAKAKNAIMDCCYATVAGDGNNLCILLAGAKAQSNAVFWNSNDQYAMNSGYFPVPYYNLCGDAAEVVTGFGRQYNDLVLFKEQSVGKLVFGVESVDERDSVSFAYQSINAKIGCDLPWSIQLVENNLVFCNTRQGVHLVASSSAAYENNIIRISENVNGGNGYGLLRDVRKAGVVTSLDDGERYWLCTGGHVYAWDYHVSNFSAPSWFYFTRISGVAFFRDSLNHTYHLDADGRVTLFDRVFSDYGEAIDKIYAFPTQYFGGYDRHKDILYLLVTVRSDTDTKIRIRYDTDYEQREDLTPITSFAWRLVPRNLAHRCLAPFRYGRVAKRDPGCKHVRHFAMRLENHENAQDLAIVSAQIYFRYTGRER